MASRTTVSLAALALTGALACVCLGQQEKGTGDKQTPTLAQAQDLLDEQRWTEAAALLEQITQAEPKNARAWFQLGHALHADGKLDQALEIHLKASRFLPVKAAALYNAACVHALQGRKGEAFKALEKARRAGAFDREGMQNDSDLESLRDDKRFVLPSEQEFRDIEMRDGATLRCAIVRPADFDKAETYPVLIALGPGREDEAMAQWGVRSFWGEQAASRGWITVAPVAPSGERWFSDEGRSLMAELLDSLENQFTIEGGKFHIAGCSNGGRSAFHIALEFPDRFHSVTVVPGIPSGQDTDRLDRLKGMQITMFAGGDDSRWVAGAKRTRKLLRKLGVKTRLKVYKGDGHRVGSLLADRFMLQMEKLRVKGDPRKDAAKKKPEPTYEMP